MHTNILRQEYNCSINRLFCMYTHAVMLCTCARACGQLMSVNRLQNLKGGVAKEVVRLSVTIGLP